MNTVAQAREMRMQPHRVDNRFYNYAGEVGKAVLLPSCLMYCAGWFSRAGGITELQQWHADFESAPEQQATEALHPYAPRITWIGHASFLLEFGNSQRSWRILLDPVFDDLTLLFPRYVAPGILRAELPPIDYVLISHNHRDHLEEQTVRHLVATNNPLFLVPCGDARWLEDWGVTWVHEYTWWEGFSAGGSHGIPSLRCTFLPAYHWSQRSLFDRNRSLWGSWMIEYDGYRCYFAGDTAYGPHFSAIAREFGSIDTALMPIGPCEPTAWLRKSHLSAEEAGEAFLELNARTCIPMHWGTYGFGIDRPIVPFERFTAWWQQANLRERILCPLRIGQSLCI